MEYEAVVGGSEVVVADEAVVGGIEGVVADKVVVESIEGVVADEAVVGSIEGVVADEALGNIGKVGADEAQRCELSCDLGEVRASTGAVVWAS